MRYFIQTISNVVLLKNRNNRVVYDYFSKNISVTNLFSIVKIDRKTQHANLSNTYGKKFKKIELEIHFSIINCDNS